MIDADQVIKAADLLWDRDEISERLSAMQSAAKIQLRYTRSAKDDDGINYSQWSDGPTFEAKGDVFKLLTGAVEEELHRIDAALKEMGINPPSPNSND